MANPVHTKTALLEETPVILPGHDFETVTETVAEIPLSKRFPLGWIGFLLVGLAVAGMLQMALGYLVIKGIGIWGNNVPVGWAFDIINFVWWIGARVSHPMFRITLAAGSWGDDIISGKIPAKD